MSEAINAYFKQEQTTQNGNLHKMKINTIWKYGRRLHIFNKNILIFSRTAGLIFCEFLERYTKVFKAFRVTQPVEMLLKGFWH